MQVFLSVAGRTTKFFYAFVACALIVFVVYFNEVDFESIRAFIDRRSLTEPQKLFVTEPENLPSEAYKLLDSGIEIQNAQTEFNIETDTNETDTFEEPRIGDKHIICLETRCLLNRKYYNYKGLLLHPRQVCSLESAARMNPDYKVYLMYSCPIIGGLEKSKEFVKALLIYPNVKLWRLNVTDQLLRSPLKGWNFRAAIRSSYWPNEHASDVLRLLTLWKYGGTYMDLDVIVLKSFADLGSNYIGMQSSQFLANGVMNFAHEGVGHELTTKLLLDLRDNFRGDLWTQNGASLIGRVMLEFCGVHEILDLYVKRCKGFNFLHPEEFYAVSYPAWRRFFDESESYKVIQAIKDSHGAHFWNKLSKGATVRLGSNQAFSIMALRSCPRLFERVEGGIM